MSLSAMKQALEALDAYSWEQVDAARAALRQAIAEAEKQEPVKYKEECWACGCFKCVCDKSVPKPSREWVNLTYDEIERLVETEEWYNHPADFARTVQFRLKEKNT